MNMNYDPTNAGKAPGQFQNTEQSYITKVFNWMFMGLLTSGLVSYLVATNPFLIRTLFSNMFLPIILAIGLLALVWNLSANILKMSPQAAAMNFFIYSALNGVLLSTIFLVYTAGSLFSTFCVAAATFGIMAVYGATTKNDLTKIGSIAIMALLGLIVAQIANIFFHNSGLESIINYAGVLIFVALTAYDVQKIKEIGQSVNYHPNMAVSGALALYLDFINLFLFLLRILGNRRD